MQLIYKDGEIDLINKLWNECRQSFDIQPYDIIEDCELDLDDFLGSGTFGSVKRGIWNSSSGPIPVAVKVIQENTQMFDLSDLRGEVCKFVRVLWFFLIFLFSLLLCLCLIILILLKCMVVVILFMIDNYNLLFGLLLWI